MFPGNLPDRVRRRLDPQNALTLESDEVRAIVDATRSGNLVVLVGFAERSAAGVFNSQLVVQSGTVLGLAHKTMLTQGYDDRHFVTDFDLPVFRAHGLVFGVAICHSTSFVEPALYLRRRGARLLVTPHFNTIRPETRWGTDGRMTMWEHRQMVLNNQAALATLLKIVAQPVPDPVVAGAGGVVVDLTVRTLGRGRPPKYRAASLVHGVFVSRPRFNPLVRSS